MPARERNCTAKNRVRESRSPGSVRDEGSNVLVYSDRLSLTNKRSMSEVKSPAWDAKVARQFFVIAMFDTTASPTLGLKSSLRRPLVAVTGKVRVMTVR
jgi:hypothetical protein